MKQVVILGAGESGLGAALLAQKQGYALWVSDFGTVRSPFREELIAAGIPFEEQGHSEDKVLAADLVIKSPGIPEKAPIVRKIREQGIELISEIEFAYRHTDAKIIGITGSNGKSTTTKLIAHVMKKAGLNVAMVGNIGDSFARAVATGNYDHYVVEVSSFQLDDIRDFRPHIAVLTNITPDHLDRYENNFELYARAKFRITENQTAEDHFLYCMDDAATMERMPDQDIKAIPYGFSYDPSPGAVAWQEHDAIQLTMNLDRSAFSIESMTLQGRHNMYNSMAAAISGRILGVRKDSIREAFSDFEGLEHRLEKVANVRGVQFINDSKATNVNSAWYALESVNRPIIWIAGGVDKGNDYNLLMPLVERKVKYIVALGEDVLKIHQAFSKKVDMIVNTRSMGEAVKMGYHLADDGDCVLLAPACASFDLFDNFEDRGRQFKEWVKQL